MTEEEQIISRMERNDGLWALKKMKEGWVVVVDAVAPFLGYKWCPVTRQVHLISVANGNTVWRVWGTAEEWQRIRASSFPWFLHSRRDQE